MHIFLKRTQILLALGMVLVALLLGGCFRKHIASAPPVKRPATQPVQAVEQTPPAEAEPEAMAAEPVETASDNPDIVEETYEVDVVDKKELPQVDESDLGAAAEEPTATEPATEQAVEKATETAPAEMESAQPAATEEAAAPAMTETSPEPMTEPVPAAETAPAAEPEAAAKAVAEPEAAAATATGTTAATETTAETGAEAEAKTTEKAFADPEEEVVDLGEMPAPVSAGEMHYVQVGAFSKSANADAVATTLTDQGFDVTTTMSTKGLYLVRVGGYPDGAAAKEALTKLKEQFPSSYIVKWDPAAK